MGTEALWVPLVLAAVGTGVSVYNTRKTAKNQDRALANQIDNQAKKRAAADAKTGELIDQTAASSPEDSKNKALQQYTQQLMSAAPNATAGLQGRGGASSRFNEESKAAALGIQEYGGAQAALNARIDAPQRQRDEEAFARSRTASSLSSIERDARMREFLDGLGVKRAGQRNAGLDALAGLLSGAASSYGSAGAGAGTAGASSGAAGVGNSFFQGGGMAGWGI